MTDLVIPDIDPEADTLTAALEYAKAGWYVGPIVPDDSKHAGNYLRKDWPAKTSRDPKTIIAWFAGRQIGQLGIFLHVGRSGAWAADVDNPAAIHPALAAAIHELRPPQQSSRPDQSGRGHYLFATPPGRVLGNSTGQLGKEWGEARGLNGIIVVWPTPRSDGGRYQWLRTGRLPTLPESIAELLPESGPGEHAVDDATLSTFLTAHTRNDRPTLFTAVLNGYRNDIAGGGSRHDAARDAACWAMREAAMGLYPALAAAVQLRDLYVADRAESRDSGRAGVGTETARSEFRGLLAWAIGQMPEPEELERRRAEILQRTPDREANTGAPTEGPPNSHDSGRAAGTTDADDVKVKTEAVALGALADGHRATDVGNADRLVAIANGRIRYVQSWQKWIVYRYGAWHLDSSDAMVEEVAKGVARRLFQTAADLIGDRREDMWKWAKRSETAPAVRAMVHLARGTPGVITDHTELDQHPWLLNVANGEIDLRTGVLHPHDPEHLLTKQSPIVYDPNAEAPLWSTCLATWQPDDEMRSFLQRSVGSAATGHPVELLFVNLGGGGNGKGKFFGAIQRALGPYAVVPDKSLFVTTRHDPHPTVKADLYGARMIIAPETDRADRLNEAQVKELTGGDPISARRMRENPWKFWPSWTAFVHTNHRPQVRGTDDGVWRRLRLIPWAVTIPAGQRDEHLAERLMLELPGILRWIVDGAMAYLGDGIDDEPEAVKSATADYREQEDQLGRFLTECCKLGEGRYAYAADLRKRYEQWCQGEGEQPLAPKTVAAELRRRGVSKAPSGRHRWLGIGLLDEDPEGASDVA